MDELGSKNCSKTQQHTQQRRPVSLNNFGGFNNADEPSFEEKYPEGKERLFALAESTKSHQQQNGSSNGCPSPYSNSNCNGTPVKPKMGLKDVRHNRLFSNQNRSQQNRQFEEGDSENSRSFSPVLSASMYSSEQSLPDKLTQALKGGISMAFRGTNSSSSAKHGDVEADDVVYFSGNDNDVLRQAKSRQQQYKLMSKSTEKLHQPGRLRLYEKSENSILADRPKNLAKVKTYAEYGMNLEDLRKLYRSMPDCSTPGNDYETEDNGAEDAVNNNALHMQNGRAVESQPIRNGATRWNESQCDDCSTDNQVSTRLNDVYHRQAQMQQPHPQDHLIAHHFRQNSDVSMEADSKRTQLDQQQPQQSQNVRQPRHRTSVPSVVDFRDSCGSPTDSGYRSVPRDDEPSSGGTPTSRVPSYTCVPKTAYCKAETSTCNILIDSNEEHSSRLARNNSDQRSKSRQRPDSSQSGLSASQPRHVPEDPANGSLPCHSPYSDLSSPNYGTTSSSGASSSAVLATGPGSTAMSSVHMARAGVNANGQQAVLNSKIGAVMSPAAVVVNCANGGSFDTINTNVSLPEEFSLERCPKLIEMDRVPWNEKDVVTVLQRGRTKAYVNYIAIDVVPRLAYLLQRPLVRIAREAQRLCQRFNKCTKFDVQFATRIVLPSFIGESCQKAALQATAMYMMSCETLKQSKSHRAGLRGLSVGKCQRWMCDAQVALCVHDQAAVYLTAVVENLLEEIVLQSLPLANDGSMLDMLTAASLDAALSNNVELWGLLQPYSHLICSRTANGILALPNQSSPSRQGSTKSMSSSVMQKNDCHKSAQHEKNNCLNGTALKNLEQCLLATCVGSTRELGELINRVLHNQLKSGSNPCLNVFSKQSPLTWSKDALQTLFYFVRCSQLEHADNPQSAPPALVLAHERPYLVLPPLIEWLRVSHAHCEHRQGQCVDNDDVLQAARILLPGLDCPPRPFGFEDHFSVNGRLSPQTCSLRLKHDLALKMLTSGSPDLVTQAIALIGSQKLDAFNEQGLTPLMWACLQCDEHAARMLLDAGADVNVCVPTAPNTMAQQQQQKANFLPELAGWTALTFAVEQRNYAVANLLLERGACLEAPFMVTETPLQIAAMMGHHDIVNLLTAKGADPFHSTAQPDAGFKQRGCAAPLSLAAAHGQRTVVQAMLARRRGKSEEVLSLEDFLAESVHSPTNANNNINNAKNSQPVSKSTGQLNNQQASSVAWLGKLTKSQQKTLQDAMYQAAECGHVDITMDLRHLGIPWNTHVWTQTLSMAHDLRRKALVQLLLGDFVKYNLDDVTQEFIDDCLPLLFEIFRYSKNEVSTSQLADILARLYGDEPIPSISNGLSGADANQNVPRIDAKYVNNPDLSDVQFLVDGRIFYGHKIVLVNASDRFKRLLQDGSAAIEIDGVRYEVFKLMMEFLYNGKPVSMENMDLPLLSQLLCAASEFNLAPLRAHCEALIAKCLGVENCIDIYRFAVNNDATELMRYCEGYFLQNLPMLISRVDGYRRLMYNGQFNMSTASAADISKNATNSTLDSSNVTTNSTSTNSTSFDLCDALLQTLTQRLEKRMNSFHKKL